MKEVLFISKMKLKKDIPKNNYLSELPVIRNLFRKKELSFDSPITFFVGENGIGKSTLIEAIAINFGFPPEGGTKNYNYYTKNTHSDLFEYITLVKTANFARKGYFLRAESFYNTISYLDYLVEEYGTDRNYFQHLSKESPNPSLHHNMSHGESFLNLVVDQFTGNGLYILDEPEAALSPMGIMRLMRTIYTCAKQGSQFIISTHSPLLTTIPNSTIYQLTEEEIEKVSYKQTLHYVMTRRFLENPGLILEDLLEGD